MDEAEWIEREAAALLDLLADERVRAEVLAQLGGDGAAARARRRREAAAWDLEARGLLDPGE